MRIRVGGILLLIAVILTGCSKNDIGVTKNSSLVQPIVSSDYNRANDYRYGNNVQRTDKGYYYLDYYENALKYYDIETGKNIYLCNKPECKHDGNAFCVATNDKYRKTGFALYSDRIFTVAVDETDTDYLYKIFTVSLDGSEMSEFLTYFCIEKAGVQAIGYTGDQLFIHRNKMFLPIETMGDAGIEDTMAYGAAIVDLETKEVKFLDEEHLSVDNGITHNVSACGDYFYICREVEKRKKLYRYNILTEELEELPLLTNFGGKFAVYDDDNIFYLRTGGKFLCVYHPSTGKNEEERPFVEEIESVLDNGDTFTFERSYAGNSIITDGEYLYIGESGFGIMNNDNVCEYHLYMHIFKPNFQEVSYVDVETLFADEYEEQYSRLYSIAFVDNDVLLVSDNNIYNSLIVRKSDREAFINGKLEFEKLFTGKPREMN